MQGAARIGRPRTARQAAKEELARVTLEGTPEGAIMDQAASDRIFSIAPHFTEKLEDIADLYFDPPARSFLDVNNHFPFMSIGAPFAAYCRDLQYPARLKVSSASIESLVS